MIRQITKNQNKKGKTTTNIQLRLYNYEYTTTNIQLRMYNYEYTTTNIQLRIYNYEYTTTNTHLHTQRKKVKKLTIASWV